MRHLLPIAMLAWLVLHTAAQAQPQRYSMRDLRALAKQGAWAELLQHAQDVRPAKRNADWKQLVRKAATQHLRNLEGRERIRGLFTAEAMLRQHPFLKRHKPYMKARADVGLEVFERCYQLRGYNCTSQLEQFMKGDPDHHKLTYRAAKVLAANTTYSSAARWFLRAIKGSGKTAWCDHAQVASAIETGLGRSGGKVTQAATELVQICWHHGVRKPVLDAFAESPDGHLAKNMCKALVDRDGALSSFKRGYCRELLAEEK